MESQLLMAMSGLGVCCAGWVAASLVVDRLDVTLCSVTTSKIGQPRRMRNRPRSVHGLFPEGRQVGRRGQESCRVHMGTVARWNPGAACTSRKVSTRGHDRDGDPRAE